MKLKRNTPLRIAAVLLALVLITTIGMTGTLAKYVKPFEGIGGTVARAGMFFVACPQDSIVASGTLREGDDSGIETHAKKYTATDPLLDLELIVPGSLLKLQSDFDIVNYSEVDVEIAITDLILTSFTPALLYRTPAVGVPADGSAYVAPGAWMTDTAFCAAVADGTIDLADIIFGSSFIIPAQSSTGAALAAAPTYTLKVDMLWPFSNGDGGVTVFTPCICPGGHDPASTTCNWNGLTALLGDDGVVSKNTDAADTAIGYDEQAMTLLTETPVGSGNWVFASVVTPKEVEFELKIMVQQID